MAANSECSSVFGSGEVFAEFECVPITESSPNAESVKKKSRKKSALDKKISRLVAENERLKEKLRMIIQPRGIHIEDGRYDGPIAQVMFMNHSIVRKYRQEIEDFFEELATKHIEGEHQREQNLPHPQSSSVKLLTDGDPEKEEAFTAVGNVQFFNQFCIDKIGKPLLNGNPRLTVGWCIPDYEQMFSESLPEDDQPSGQKKRQKACCFNCGEDDHAVRDCPQPQDLARISMNKKKFQMSLPNIPTSKRYHLDEENVEKFKAGVLSEELRNALGLKPNQLPLHIYQMRLYGYSPGHLKEAEAVKSGLTVYDNHDDNVGGRQTEQQPNYDHDKLICFPGFNVDVPYDMLDECERFRMPPMQPNHRIETFTKRLPKSTERKHTSKRRKNFADDDTTEEIKRRRIENRLDESMDISVTDSDTEGTYVKAGESPTHDENFKPPLPPTPGYRTPPPLPTSTPPPTPGRTPQSGPCSPQIQDASTPVMSRTPSCGSLDSDANNIGSFSPCSVANSQEGSRTESPTLDDLEQQRLNLLSAFEDGDTEGTSDTGEMITVNGELFTITDCENESNTVQSASQDEDSQSGDVDSTNKTPSSLEESSEEVQVPLKDPGYSSERTENEGYESGELEEKTEVKTEEMTKFLVKDDLTPNKSGVPHWSKFSKNISPHPPDENLMESKGVFKRICSILKRKIKKDS